MHSRGGWNIGAPRDLRLYARARHEFVNIQPMLDVAMADVALFLRRVLIERPKFDVEQRELFGLTPD